jgi:ubiquinone/menaquinone biosynthesis C-methylase UbiE
MPSPPPDDGTLKRQVQEYWNRQSCDTQVAVAAKHTREYFDQIETFRYYDQPFIHAFAQFTRYHGKRVLEVGFGAGTDFIQWLRAGAVASGVDLTPEGLDHLRHRIAVYQLPAPERIAVADAEHLPFADQSFDLGYSFGVLHHTPNTERALAELVRVVRPGGELKVMLYNRRSVYVFNQWVKRALLRGQPWHGLHWVLANHVESPGTKGYTRAELRRLLKALPLEWVEVETVITGGDYLSSAAFWPLNRFYRLLIAMAGQKHGWQPEQYVERGATAQAQPTLGRTPGEMLFTGNPFGFFHCICARRAG